MACAEAVLALGDVGSRPGMSSGHRVGPSGSGTGINSGRFRGLFRAGPSGSAVRWVRVGPGPGGSGTGIDSESVVRWVRDRHRLREGGPTPNHHPASTGPQSPPNNSPDSKDCRPRPRLPSEGCLSRTVPPASTGPQPPPNNSTDSKDCGPRPRLPSDGCLSRTVAPTGRPDGPRVSPGLSAGGCRIRAGSGSLERSVSETSRTGIALLRAAPPPLGSLVIFAAWPMRTHA